MEKNESPVKKEKQLGEFAEEHQKLLSVLGIFTALSAFSINLPIKLIGSGLAFIFLAISVLLWIEVLRRIPSDLDSSFSLILFQILITLGLLLLCAYWLLDFRVFWHGFLHLALIMPFGAAIATGSFWLLTKVESTKPIFAWVKRSKFGKFLLIAVFTVVFVVCGSIAGSILAPPINRLLDKSRKDLDQIWAISQTNNDILYHK